MRIIKHFYEKNLTVPEAMAIFGITGSVDEEELKKIYKKLSFANHPDHGGSTDKMQDINQAYDLLKKNVGNTSSTKTYTYTDADRAADKKKAEAAYERKKKMFEEDYDQEKMKDYLQQFMQEPLIAEPLVFPKGYYNDNFTAYSKIHTSDNKTYFEIYFSVEETNKGGLSYTGIDEKDILFSVSTSTSIYHAARSFKIGQSRYNWQAGRKSLLDPKEIFPPVKIKKILSGEKKKLFRRADMELGMKRELPYVNFDKDIYFIYPFGKDERFYFNLGRLTMPNFGARSNAPSARVSYYTFGTAHFIDANTQKYSNARTQIAPDYAYSFLETEEGLEKLVDMVKEVVDQVKKQKFDIKNDGLKIVELFKNAIFKYFPKDKK